MQEMTRIETADFLLTSSACNPGYSMTLPALHCAKNMEKCLLVYFHGRC